jgi:DNA-directed RNA polymerase subunit RPC12/RpoP
MQLSCPSCEKALAVPDGSVGRRARCPACEHRFTVADPQDAMEETISAWITADAEQIKQLRQRHASLNEGEPST